MENALTLWRPVAFGDFREKATEIHVALCGNFSGPISSEVNEREPRMRKYRDLLGEPKKGTSKFENVE